MRNGRAQTADEILAEMKREWAKIFRFYSNLGKEERERWVAHAFVTALGIPAAADAFTSPPQNSKVDVHYREAQFQIKEIVDPTSQRGKEIKEIYERVMRATTLAEAVGPGYAYDVSEPVDGTTLAMHRAAELTTKYDAATRAELDLLIYVTRTRVSPPDAKKVDPDAAAALAWRSISVLGGEHGVVLFAAEKSPTFLRATNEASLGAKALETSALQIGDIVLTTTTARLSKAIRAGTKSDISHAMVVVDPHSLIDSTGDGVQARNPHRLRWPDKCAVHVLRMKRPLTGDEKRVIVNAVRLKIGTRYSLLEAAQSITGRGKRLTRKQFCSRLVAQAYAAAGIKLVSNPNYCTPNALKKSTLLERVPGATRMLSAEEIFYRDTVDDTTRRMLEATNALLDGARSKNPSIEDLNDIKDHLIVHPEDDTFFADLYRTSGYLTVWEFERAKNPWQYSLAALTDEPLPEAAKVAYCENLLSDGEEGLVRYEDNYAEYEKLARTYPLQTLRLLENLYDTLRKLHVARREAAAGWLSITLGRPVPERDPAVLHRPHSSAWFDALQAWNPNQAAMTRVVLDRMGNDEVCSVCGDDPAKDYRLIGPEVPTNVVSTLRLCDECCRIRSAMFSESLALFQ